MRYGLLIENFVKALKYIALLVVPTIALKLLVWAWGITVIDPEGMAVASAVSGLILVVAVFSWDAV